MHRFIDVADRCGAVTLFQMMSFTQLLLEFWKLDSEVSLALGELCFCRGSLVFPGVCLLFREVKRVCGVKLLRNNRRSIEYSIL